MKLKDNLIQKEKKNCTFKPFFESKSTHRSASEKVYKYPKKKDVKKIYERGKDYKNKLNKKLKIIKNESDIMDKVEYSFKPEINHDNIERILYGKNLWDELANNLSNELFLRRYKKARKIENLKNKNKIWNLYNYEDDSKNKCIKDNNKNIHKSISQKDSLLYRQTLHNYLLEYESNNDDNEEKKNNNIKIIKN